MKFQSHNLHATPESMDAFLTAVVAPVIMETAGGRRLRAVSEIMAETQGQIRRPLALVRLRRPLSMPDGYTGGATTYPPGRLCLIGWRRIAIEVPGGE